MKKGKNTMKDFAVSVIFENKYDYLISAKDEDEALDKAVEAAFNRENGDDVDEENIKAEGFDTDMSYTIGEVHRCKLIPFPSADNSSDDEAEADFPVISVPEDGACFEDCDADEYEPDDTIPFICDVCRHRGECSNETKLGVNIRELTRAYLNAAESMVRVYGQK